MINTMFINISIKTLVVIAIYLITVNFAVMIYIWLSKTNVSLSQNKKKLLAIFTVLPIINVISGYWSIVIISQIKFSNDNT